MKPIPKDAAAVGQVYEELFRILIRGGDIGTFKTITNWLFEPPNPFDPNQRRKPKPEILILLTYMVLMGATFAAFNLW
jgi:hypothetical protein